MSAEARCPYEDCGAVLLGLARYCTRCRRYGADFRASVLDDVPPDTRTDAQKEQQGQSTIFGGGE